jgi:hypothetical protein
MLRDPQAVYATAEEAAAALPAKKLRKLQQKQLRDTKKEEVTAEGGSYRRKLQQKQPRDTKKE